MNDNTKTLPIAVYPGSFDPITKGHIDVIKRISPLYSRFIVLIAQSSIKNYLFSPKERAFLAKEAVKDIPCVQVDICDGLVVNYAEALKARVLIRSLRSFSDLEQEMTLAHTNRQLKPSIETLIVISGSEYLHISSRWVKEVAQGQGDLSSLVTDNVAQALKEKFKTSL